MPDFPRILALVADERKPGEQGPPRASGCSMWRVFSPFSALQRQGYPAEWAWKDDDRIAALVDRFDAVLLPRLSWKAEYEGAALQWFATLRRAGLSTIYEVDDDLFSAYVPTRLQQTTQRDKTLPELEAERQARIFALQQCDGVTVTTRRLATVVGQHTDAPIEVVPNSIDLAWFREVQRHGRRIVDGLTIGWAGGVRPDRDVSIMAEAWGRIARRFPSVTFVVQGHQPAIIAEHVPAERTRRLPWLPLEAYPLGLVNVDIGCCPLMDEPFNRCKSTIKALEYAASGAAVVASPTVYGGLIDHGYDGFTCETVDEWEAALAYLVESQAGRSITARRLVRKVEKQHSLEGNVWRWVAAWSNILQSARSKPRLLVA